MIKNNFNLQWIYSFRVIAQEQSLTKAAKLLKCSQPALSKQMDELENIVKVPLLERGRRSVALTEAGNYFYSKSEEITTLLEQTIRDLSPCDMINGEVILGGCESVGMSYLTEIFARLQKQHPQIRLHIVSGDAPVLAERLQMGTVHMALMVNPKHEERFDYLDLKLKDRFGLLVPEQDALGQMSSITLEMAAKLPLIFPARMYEECKYSGWHGIKHSELNVVSTYNLISNVTFMVEQGFGYALALEGLVNTKGRNLKYIPFEPEVTGKLYMVTKKYQTFSPADKLFLKYIKEELEANE